MLNKRIIFSFTIFIILFIFTNCGSSPIKPGFGIRITNNSDKNLTIKVWRIKNKEISTSNITELFGENPNEYTIEAESVTDVVQWDMLLDYVPADTAIHLMQLVTTDGTILYTAVGWPKEWEYNNPEGFTLEETNYDRYGFGYSNYNLEKTNYIYGIEDGIKYSTNDSVLTIDYSMTIDPDLNIQLNLYKEFMNKY